MTIRAFASTRVPRPRNVDSSRIPFHLPLDLEIGCGVGWHPITYALTHPDRFLIAIEHTQEKFSKFKRRIEAHKNPNNLLPIHANAISWVTHVLRQECLDRVFILYPNPTDFWYKRPFFGHLLDCIRPGGSLTLATNLESYAREAKKILQENWKLTLTEESHPIQPRTHFEKKYLARGQTCWNQVWTKTHPAFELQKNPE